MNKPRIERDAADSIRVICVIQRLLHMSFREAIFIALSSLRANRLRSLLTLLGIVIGVMTVIAVVSFISGLNDYVAQKIFNLGPDVFIVSRTAFVTMPVEDFVESQKRRNLYLEDMEAVRRACTDCQIGRRIREREGPGEIRAAIPGFVDPGLHGRSACDSRQ